MNEKRNTGKKETKSCNSVLLLSLINILGIVHGEDIVQARKQRYILLGVTVPNSWSQNGLHLLEPSSSPCNKPSQWQTCAPQEQSSTPDQFYRSLPRDEHHYTHAMGTPLSSLNHLTKWTGSLQQKATPSAVPNLLFRLLPCHSFLIQENSILSEFFHCSWRNCIPKNQWTAKPKTGRNGRLLLDILQKIHKHP